MNEKPKQKKFNTNYLTFALGLGLSLIAVALMINQVPVIIQINFAFFYVFGLFYYILLVLLFGLGIVVMLKPIIKAKANPTRKKKWYLEIIGLSVFVITFLLLTGIVGPKEIIPLSQTSSVYHSYYGDYLSNYKATTPVNIFVMAEGQSIGGFLGTLLSSLFAFGTSSKVGPILFFALFLIISLILILNKPLLTLIKIMNLSIEQRKKKKLEYEEIASLGEEDKERALNETEEETSATPVNIKDEPVIVQQTVIVEGQAMTKAKIGDTTDEFTPQPVNSRVNEPKGTIYEEQIEEEPEVEETFDNEIEEPAIKEVPHIEVKKPVVEEPVIIKKDPAPVIRKKKNYIYPGLDLLDEPEADKNYQLNFDLATRRVEDLNTIFEDLGVGAHAVSFKIGPAVTRFDIAYDAKVKSTSVRAIVPDISIRLGGVGARFEELVIGKSTSGLEVPNAKTSPVFFKDVMTQLNNSQKDRLMVPFGKNIDGEIVFGPLDRFPHMLVAGTTGSGKSVFVHAVIMTLIMRNAPSDLRLLLIDPKRVEMSKYREIGHLLCPIITEPLEAKTALERLVDMMEDRYTLFEQNEVNSITSYNNNIAGPDKPKLPYIVIVIEEFADLMDATNGEVSAAVKRLGQKSRAAGIHMVIAVQRPSVKSIPGDIKANITTRVALTTASSTDSTVVIGQAGAEQLLGRGDMLVDCTEISRTGLVRFQGCYVKESEMSRIGQFIREQGAPEYDENFINLKPEEQEIVVYGPSGLDQRSQIDDEKYYMVREAIFDRDYASISFIQTSFGGGFNTARRYFFRLQDEGIIEKKPSVPAKGCKVLVHSLAELERKMAREGNESDDETSD